MINMKLFVLGINYKLIYEYCTYLHTNVIIIEH